MGGSGSRTVATGAAGAGGSGAGSSARTTRTGVTVSGSAAVSRVDSSISGDRTR